MLKKITLIVLTVLVTSLYAQWENPAKRYLEEYKKYEEAKGPIPEDGIKHFVYFARDREAIKNHPLLTNSRFLGAQVKYPWRLLETSRDEYDFSQIREDINYLSKHGKKLFINIQDATFSPKRNPVPKYLQTKEFDGGALLQIDENGDPEGWVAKRWNKNVQKRFEKLLMELGREFDGIIEGVNLQETAIGVSNKQDKSFTPKKYVKGIKRNMLSLSKAFPNSTKIQNANFIPGEFLPWEDHGYLRSIYDYGEKIGVGLGNPDLMYKKKAQLNNPLAMMHEGSFTVPISISIQDGNYIGETNNEDIKEARVNLVPSLHAFAKDFLRVNYMFWVNQEPYFIEDVLPNFPSN